MIQNETLQGLFQINTIPCEIVIYMLLFMAFNNAYEHKLVRQFLMPVILLGCLIISDNFDYLMYDNNIEGFPHILTAVLGYNIRILIFISLIRISIKNNILPITKFALYIPELFNLVVCILAFNTRLVFWYEGEKTMRGPLAYIPHMVFALYVFIMLVIAIRKLMIGKHNEGVYIILAVFLSAVAVAVEMLFALRGILMGAIALDIFCYYLYFHIEHYKFDTLTDARNRSDFEATLKKGGKIFAVLSCDMNGLKEINDTMGHYYGDLALIATSHAIQISLPRKCDLYRVGGDEFVILINNEIVDIDKLCEKIYANVLAAGCTVAIGAAKIEDYEDFKEAYNVSDKEMYENKKEMKKDKKTFAYFNNKTLKNKNHNPSKPA